MNKVARPGNQIGSPTETLTLTHSLTHSLTHNGARIWRKPTGDEDWIITWDS